MRVVGSTAVVVVAMMLVVPTAGAPTRALEEMPPGTKLLAGEITSGVVVGARLLQSEARAQPGGRRTNSRRDLIVRPGRGDAGMG